MADVTASEVADRVAINGTWRARPSVFLSGRPLPDGDRLPSFSSLVGGIVWRHNGTLRPIAPIRCHPCVPQAN